MTSELNQEAGVDVIDAGSKSHDQNKDYPEILEEVLKGFGNGDTLKAIREGMYEGIKHLQNGRVRVNEEILDKVKQLLDSNDVNGAILKALEITPLLQCMAR